MPLKPLGDCCDIHYRDQIYLSIKKKFVKTLTPRVCSQENIFLSFKESVGKTPYWKHWELKNLGCLLIKSLEDACSTIMSAYLQLFKLLALSGAVEPSFRKTDLNAAPYDYASMVQLCLISKECSSGQISSETGRNIAG